jgi:DnaJ-class molecular chaperone
MLDNPYDVLELPHNTSFSEVRLKYYKLAKIHHPDKYNGTDTEKSVNEEYFKKVTVAYHHLEQKEKNGGIDESFLPNSKEDWRSVWSSVDTFFMQPDAWKHMRTIFKDALKEVATKTFQKHHSITLQVTLEEVHMQKLKKLRLFLKNISEPIFIHVNASNFPFKRIQHMLSTGEEIDIDVDIKILKHSIYTTDALLGTYDLYATYEITLGEYISGKSIKLPYLDNSKIDIEIKPFAKIEKPIIFSNKGLFYNDGDLYIKLEIILPTKDMLLKQPLEFQENLLNSLNALYEKSTT